MYNDRDISRMEVCIMSLYDDIIKNTKTTADLAGICKKAVSKQSKFNKTLILYSIVSTACLIKLNKRVKKLEDRNEGID